LFSALSACDAQQVSSASAVFATATIKPTDPNRSNAGGDIGFSQGGSFDAKSQSLKELIQSAYDLGFYDVDRRIIGGPKWIGSARFDVAAKCDEESASAFKKMTSKQQISLEQAMIQTLLADRFRLRLHHESRRLQVYALILAKGPSKLRPSANTDSEDPGFVNGPPGNWEGDSATMEGLASQLSTLPEIGGRIVVNKTGLKGVFKVELKWTPDPTMGVVPATSDNGGKLDPSAPSLFTALQEQLGLKLEPSKEPVDVIVIDSAELPSPN
jgi:uncharacterized protein (TIGR03435 family)